MFFTSFVYCVSISTSVEMFTEEISKFGVRNIDLDS
jgi:hypothetical protein